MIRSCVVFLYSFSVFAGSISFSFEGFADGTMLTNQYSNATFTNAVVLSAGNSLNEFEFPPHSGVNVVSDSGGPITIAFDTPVTSFSGFFTYLVAVTLAGFDAADEQVASATSTYLSNDALSGDLGSSPNEFIHIDAAGGLSRVRITGDPSGGSFVMDDAAYFSVASGVPEPGTLALLLSAGIALAAVKRGRK